MAASMLIAAVSTATTAITAGSLVGSAFMFGSALTHFLVTTAMGVALNALAPKPNLAGQRGFSLRGESGAALDHQIIYGEARVGGARIYDSATGDSNQYLHRILAFAGHEIDSYQEIYLNDEVVVVDPVTFLVTSPEKYAGKVRIKEYFGTTSQTADALLIAETEAQLTSDPTFEGVWTTDHKLSGIAYLYIRFEYDANAFPNGVPAVSAKIRGKKVFNPSTSTTAWSDNPALCIRDYLTNDYGLNQPSGRIDDTLVNAAAVVSDQITEGEKRYTCNGAFTTGAAPSDVLTNLLTSMGGLLWYGQGKWRMKAAAWTTPNVSFDENDLRSSISLSTRHSRRDNFNSVKGTFAGDETGWQPTDYPEVTDPAFLIADNNVPNVLDFTLPFTSSSKTAQRIARIALNRNREQITFSASFSLKALQVQVGDFVYINNERFGWSNKAFEIVEWTFGLADALDIRVNMTLREISEGVFTGVSGKAFEINNTTLPNAFSVPAPTNLQLSNVGYLNDAAGGDGTFIPSVLASWGASVDAFVSEYEVEWKKSSATQYNQRVVTNTQVEVSPLEAGETYQFRVRAKNALGVVSPYATNSILTTGDSTAPSAPALNSATGGYNTITLDWANPTDKDFKQALIYRNTVNNSASASLVAATAGDTYIDGALPASTTRYYWVKAEDYSGNTSGFSNVVSATTNAQPLDGQNGQNASGFIITNPAHTVPAGKSGVVESYAGSGTDISVLDGVSRLSWIDSGSPASGQFTFSAISVSPSGAITVGARTGIASGVRVADHSNMSVNEDVVTITFTVTARSFSGTSFSFNIVQSITKSSAGSDGAGRWNIPVATLPTTSSLAQAAWDAANVASRAPVESDQAWFYTGTESNPTGQSVWIYDSGTSSWNEQEEVIDGDLLVTGTVTSDKVVTNFIDAFTINANNITTGTLTADRINIDGVTLDTQDDGTGNLELIIKQAGVDTQQVATNATSSFSAVRVASSSKTFGLFFEDIQSLGFTTDQTYDVYIWVSVDVTNSSGGVRSIVFELQDTSDTTLAQNVVTLANAEEYHVSMSGFATTVNGSNSFSFSANVLTGGTLDFDHLSLQFLIRKR